MTEVLKFTILDAGLVETAVISRPGIEACGLVPYFNKLVHDTLPVLYVFPDEKGSGGVNPEVIDSLPRVCLVSGYGDFLRSMTLRYAKALDKAHHPNLLLDYDNKKKLPHAFATLMPMLAESRDAIDRMDTWMKE